MNDADHKPTIEERYAAALSEGVHSQVVLAAGMQRERLGVLLLRLRTEYDATRGSLEQAGRIAPSAAARIRALQRDKERNEALARRLSQRPGHSFDALDASISTATISAANLAAEISAIQQRTPAETRSARAAIMSSLTSLGAAREELEALSVRMAAHPRRRLPAAIAIQLSHRVLDVWLDETCHRCDGTGRIGNRYAGDTEKVCSSCKGTAHRRDILGDSLQQTMLAGDLLAELQRRVAAASAGIRAAIHADAEPSKQDSPELQRRLSELRAEPATID